MAAHPVEGSSADLGRSPAGSRDPGHRGYHWKLESEPSGSSRRSPSATGISTADCPYRHRFLDDDDICRFDYDDSALDEHYGPAAKHHTGPSRHCDHNDASTCPFATTNNISTSRNDDDSGLGILLPR
jgi:hypothetical protein